MKHITDIIIVFDTQTGNQIGDEGMKYLSEALKFKSTLTQLDLRGT